MGVNKRWFPKRLMNLKLNLTGTLKFANTEFFLPITGTGALDEPFMGAMVKNTAYWPFIEAAMA